MDNGTFYAQQRPTVIEGKLALISNGGSVTTLGISHARKTISELEQKTDLRPSTMARLELMREAVAFWENYSGYKA